MEWKSEKNLGQIRVGYSGFVYHKSSRILFHGPIRGNLELQLALGFVSFVGVMIGIQLAQVSASPEPVFDGCE